MVKECKNCGKVYDETHLSLTTDGKWVCNECWGDGIKGAISYYRKGLLSSEEIKEFTALKEKYYEIVKEFMLKLRKKCMLQGLKRKEEVKKLIEEMDKEAIKKYKKAMVVREESTPVSDSGCLEIEERIVLLGIMEEKFGLRTINKEQYSSVTADEHSDGDTRKIVEKYYYIV